MGQIGGVVIVRRPQTIDMGMCVVSFCANLEPTEREKAVFAGKATVDITSFSTLFFDIVFELFASG